MASKATVRFDLPSAGQTRLDVFDASGRRVAQLSSAYLEAGQHSLEWDARRHPSGIYLVRLEVGSSVVTRKVLLQR